MAFSGLSGTATRETFFSKSLGVDKSFILYLPPGYDATSDCYPVLYLFRGHENEWFNPAQDPTREGQAVQHLLDRMINDGEIDPLIVVGAGLTSDDGQIYGLGVNFLNPDHAAKHEGVGSGRFEDFITKDLIRHIDSNWRTIPDYRFRGSDGFSLGGYTSVMLGVKHPRLFSSTGSYDGSHMFYDMKDPRKPRGENNDDLWCRRDSMFAAVFRKPGKRAYSAEHLRAYNPLNILEDYSKKDKRRLSRNCFYVTTAANDGFQGNRDRGIHLMTILQQHGIENKAESLILADDAAHTWKCADQHLAATLPLHSAHFSRNIRRFKKSRLKHRAVKI